MSISPIRVHDEGNPEPMPVSKKLLLDEQYVFTNIQPLPGKAPKSWMSATWREGLSSETQEQYNVSVGVVGLDFLEDGPRANPVFESELLRDGYTTVNRLDALTQALTKEIQRMQNAPDMSINTQDALAQLRKKLCTLHNLGYTIQELQCLVAGTLRISITPEELLDVMLNP